MRTYLRAVLYISDDWPDLIASTGFCVLRPDNSVIPDLLGYILQSNAFIDRVMVNSIGVAYPAISETKLGTLHLAIAVDQEEQFSILTFIRQETRALDEAIDRSQREIALVQEYRERLINDVVTGKLDVRDAEISVVEEDDVPEDVEYLEEGAAADDADVVEMVDAAD